MKTNVMICSFVLFCLVSLCDSVLAVPATTNQFSYHDIIVTNAVPLSIEGLLSLLTKQTGVAFCLESSRAVGTNQMPILDLNPSTQTVVVGDEGQMTVKSHLERLTRVGFKNICYSNAVLVITPAACAIKDNPIDTPLIGFSFEGPHDAFVNKIFTNFPGIYPALFKASGMIPLNTYYKVRINEATSIREVLMDVASRYGVVWHAVIADANRSLDSNSQAGNAFHWSASRVMFTFRAMRTISTFRCEEGARSSE